MPQLHQEIHTVQHLIMLGRVYGDAHQHKSVGGSLSFWLRKSWFDFCVVCPKIWPNDERFAKCLKQLKREYLRYSQLVNLAKHAKGSGGMPQDPAAAGQYGRGQGYTHPLVSSRVLHSRKCPMEVIPWVVRQVRCPIREVTRWAVAPRWGIYGRRTWRPHGRGSDGQSYESDEQREPVRGTYDGTDNSYKTYASHQTE